MVGGRMLVYRVYEKPQINGLVWTVECLTNEGRQPIFFDTEELAVEFCRDVTNSFEPLEISDAEESDDSRPA
jgi:hypothetical protein